MVVIAVGITSEKVVRPLAFRPIRPMLEPQRPAPMNGTSVYYQGSPAKGSPLSAC
jgi:hypothetical protein